MIITTSGNTSQPFELHWGQTSPVHIESTSVSFMTESIFSLASAGIAFALQPLVRGPGPLLWSPDGDGDDDNIRFFDPGWVCCCFDLGTGGFIRSSTFCWSRRYPIVRRCSEKASTSGRPTYPRPTTQIILSRRLFETFETTGLAPFLKTLFLSFHGIVQKHIGKKGSEAAGI